MQEVSIYVKVIGKQFWKELHLLADQLVVCVGLKAFGLVSMFYYVDVF